MKKIVCAIFILTNCQDFIAQPNCNTFLWEGDTIQFEACKLSEKYQDYYQFEMKGQAILDSCIDLCPYYYFPYYEKAATYIKSGNFIEWNRNINLSYNYNPEITLPYRASCRAKYFGDYEGAIADIEELETLVEYDIGHTNQGTYHLKVWKGICYKNLGKYKIAISIINEFIQSNPEDIGYYDYLHLGVCYQKIGFHKKAIKSFQNQESKSDLAENRYYSAISFMALGKMDNFNKSLQIAQDYMNKGQTLKGGFRTLDDEIFQSDLDEIAKEFSNHN